MVAVSMKMRKFFFDRAIVVDRLGKANAKHMSILGRDTRQGARKKITVVSKPTKKQKEKLQSRDPKVRARAQKALQKRMSKSGKKGRINSRASGDPIRRIEYHYNPTTNSMMAGFVKLNKKGANVVRNLEHGGTARIRKSFLYKQSKSRKGGFTKIRIEPRYVVRNAFDKALPKYLRRMKGAVKR